MTLAMQHRVVGRRILHCIARRAAATSGSAVCKSGEFRSTGAFGVKCYRKINWFRITGPTPVSMCAASEMIEITNEPAFRPVTTLNGTASRCNQPVPDGRHCHADGVHGAIRSSDLVDNAAIVARTSTCRFDYNGTRRCSGRRLRGWQVYRKI